MQNTSKRAAQPEAFPKKVTIPGAAGISARIYRQVRRKAGAEYTSFLVYYNLLGRPHMQSFSQLVLAEEAAKSAIKKIAEGDQAALMLTKADRDVYLRALRARDSIAGGIPIPIDVLVAEAVETRRILNGIATPPEAARFFVKSHAKELPRIQVADAVKKCLDQARADGKSQARVHQLDHYLNGFAGDMNIEVSELTPGIVSRYLTAMTVAARTRKNARDVLGYFGRWLVLHGYLARGTDLVEGVQKYSMKSGDIEIFTPAELSKLIEHSDARLLPYIVIGAFAGLRGAEIQRLDWSEVDMQDGFIEVKAEKAKTDTRRLVPIQPNLKAWLEDCAKKSGPVCPFKNVVNQLMKLVAKINKSLPKNIPDNDRMRWKKNALRHSYISYRVAECADVARVADESGNSPAVIKTNYLKRVKPDQAKAWFNVLPGGRRRARKILELPAAQAATA
jgi:integrase